MHLSTNPDTQDTLAVVWALPEQVPQRTQVASAGRPRTTAQREARVQEPLPHPGLSSS